MIHQRQGAYIRGRRSAGCKVVSFPDEPDFVQNFLSVLTHFVIEVSSALRTNPHPKRHVFAVPFWHQTMAILLFKLDQLFILLLPWCIVINSPNEPDLVKKSLSFKSHFVIGVSSPLRIDPHSKRRVFLVPLWNETMTIRLFKLDQLFILPVPGLVSVPFVVACCTAFPSEPDFVQ
jgi:hypothetical protein